MVDMKVTCESAHVEVESSQYSLRPSGRITVTMDDVDLVNNVSVEDIVNEYDHSELLDAIPEHVVIQHVVSNNDPSSISSKNTALMKCSMKLAKRLLLHGLKTTAIL